MRYEHTDTQLPRESECPKLVRDRIPEIILDIEGKAVPVRILEDDNDYGRYLMYKIVEEAEELSEAAETAHILEEIADLYEVIDAIIKLKRLSAEDIKSVQHNKRARRGGFEKRILMLDQTEQT